MHLHMTRPDGYDPISAVGVLAIAGRSALRVAHESQAGSTGSAQEEPAREDAHHEARWARHTASGCSDEPGRCA
jgi:hypothetical protein